MTESSEDTAHCARPQGLGILVIVLSLSFIVRHKPEHYGYQPDGEVTNAVEAGGFQISTASEESNIPAKQALRSRTFWYIALGSMFHAFVVNAVVTHMMPYLSSLNIARSVSSLVALILPVASIDGRLGSGWLGDRLGSRRVFTASFALMTTGLLLFGNVTVGRIWLLVPFIITFSLGWGTSVTTRITLLREHYGRSSFGTIFGFTSGIMMIENVIGAPLAGWVFDTWDRYQGAWLGFSVLTIVGMVLVAAIPSPSSSTIRISD